MKIVHFRSDEVVHGRKRERELEPQKGSSIVVNKRERERERKIEIIEKDIMSTIECLCLILS